MPKSLINGSRCVGSMATGVHHSQLEVRFRVSIIRWRWGQFGPCPLIPSGSSLLLQRQQRRRHDARSCIIKSRNGTGINSSGHMDINTVHPHHASAAWMKCLLLYKEGVDDAFISRLSFFNNALVVPSVRVLMSVHWITININEQNINPYFRYSEIRIGKS